MENQVLDEVASARNGNTKPLLDRLESLRKVANHVREHPDPECPVLMAATADLIHDVCAILSAQVMIDSL